MESSRTPIRPTSGRKRGFTVDRSTFPRTLLVVAIAMLAIVLGAQAPAQARGAAGHGFGGGSPGQHGFDGHHGFEGHHGFGRDHVRFRSGPVFPYYGYDPYPPAYGSGAPSYWYYCPSYGAYYPNVASCPETWVPVPAS
jgi:hypothetical protein